MSESTKRSISRTKDQTDKSILHCANLHQTQWKMLFTPRYLLLCCAKAKKKYTTAKYEQAKDMCCKRTKNILINSINY